MHLKRSPTSFKITDIQVAYISVGKLLRDNQVGKARAGMPAVMTVLYVHDNCATEVQTLVSNAESLALNMFHESYCSALCSRRKSP